MKKALMLAAVLAASVVAAGCSTTQPAALNVTDVSKVDFSQEMKLGESCETALLGFIGPFGNSSLVRAAENGGLSEVLLVEREYSHKVLFSQHCTQAWGR